MTTPDSLPAHETRVAYRDPLSYDVVEAGRNPAYAAEWRGAVESAVGRDIANGFNTHQSAVTTSEADENTSVEQLSLKTPDMMGTHLPGNLDLTRHTKTATREQLTTISWTLKRSPSDGLHWIYTTNPGEPGRLLPATKDPQTGKFIPKTPPEDPTKIDHTSDYQAAFAAQTLPGGIRQGRPGRSGLPFRRKH